MSRMWAGIAAVALLGCRGEPQVGETAAVADTEAPAVSWHRDVAPLVTAKCGGCHAPDGIAPLDLLTYDGAAPFAELMADAVESGRMPPWGAQETDACAPRLGFQDDLRLSDDEKALLRTWADLGAPEGNPDDAAELEPPPPPGLADADVTLTIPTAVTVDGTSDSFTCFTMDPELAEDAWVDGVQVVAGNDRIVHHVLVYADPGARSVDLAGSDGTYDCFGGPGFSGAELMGAWAPGAVPTETPDDVAYPLGAGSRVVIQVHYHPTGAGPEEDGATAVQLRYADEEPAWEALLALIGNFDGPYLGDQGLQPDPDDPSDVSFRIPANKADHTETMTYQLEWGTPQLPLWLVGTHMHYVGVDMSLWVDRPEGSEQPEQECLLQTPEWDFNWQRGYRYDAPLDELPTVGQFDVLTMKCTYDNTLGNPFVAEALAAQGLDEPVDVFLGEETLDEMCLGIFGVAIPR